MNRRQVYQAHEQYIKAEGLDQFINFAENADFQESAFDNVSGKLRIPLPPEPDDLVYLHQTVRRRKSFTVLEFGLGYSTVVLADALRKNQADWERLAEKPDIRNRFMFQLFSVDASESWIENIQQRLPHELVERVHIQHSTVEIGTFNGQLCHYYQNIPDVVADFIYLDGPSPKDVKGTLNGLSFQCDERTVMSGDLLLMEPTLLPGTLILVDGRTNNARFLARNFQREYLIHWDRDRDCTTFELNEERLGKYNVLGSDFM
ncbi:MAG: class I SAM-dependent methyltransferase [Acidobacteria bacterium]|nr:class I SAM-dependent methyltransferase [Acidobacteriota bacterium]MBI3425539.1 class I SAM-dependent methyltransferase [Acidobacteriota bacterium]